MNQSIKEVFEKEENLAERLVTNIFIIILIIGFIIAYLFSSSSNEQSFREKTCSPKGFKHYEDMIAKGDANPKILTQLKEWCKK
jgi:hypothetical protein